MSEINGLETIHIVIAYIHLPHIHVSHDTGNYPQFSSTLLRAYELDRSRCSRDQCRFDWSDSDDKLVQQKLGPCWLVL